MIEKKVAEDFKNKKVLVTGGTGLIGRQVVSLLKDMGAYVTVVSLDNLKFDDGVTYVKADLRDIKVALEITSDVDYVFHMAGIKGSIEVTKSKPASFFVPYLQFNTNVLEACRINNVKKVVYTSSIGAYASAEVFVEGNITDGSPMDMYPGWAKRMAEMQIQAYREQYGLNNFTVVRPCNVYGESDNFDPTNAMVIPSLMYRILHGENPLKVWGDGSAVRDFAYSKDVAEGIILAMYYQPNVPYLNLGSGIGYTVKELVETLQKVCELDIKFNFEWDTTKSNGFPKRVMNIDLARKLINYNPTTSLEEGLKNTWNWYKNNTEEFLLRKNYFTEDK